MAGALTRRRGLMAAALGVAGIAAWTVLSKPRLPDLEAVRRGDLVDLDIGGGGRLSDPLLGIRPPRARVEVSRAVLEDETTAHARGSADGPTVVAFLDYRCLPCRASIAEWHRRADRGDIRLVVREWPILGPPSTLAARAALAADRQGGYWPLHAALMATSFVPTAGLVSDLAARNGLDAARLQAAMDAPEVDRVLQHNAALAFGIGAVGTPAYVVDGVVIRAGFAPEVILGLAARHRTS